MAGPLKHVAVLIVLILAAGTWSARADHPEEPVPTARAPAPPPPGDDGQATPAPAATARPVHWRDSAAIGLPWAGRLERGVQLPADGEHFFTWDPVLKRSPDRPWRRYGHDALIRTLLRVAREHRAAFPDAPRLAIGDLSLPRGGPFGRRYGGLGHASHQNGLDVDVYYPRRDGLERQAQTPDQIDSELAQDLVDRFVEAGAAKVFVGPRLDLTGPRKVVAGLVHHDDHMHVRIPPPPQ